ncbi:MAG: hypothetical protein KC736_05080 [Candidatus Moranbacteria bacterium]|nr:hypothetical protein [Candidatus Moranbacteria bacterium]
MTHSAWTKTIVVGSHGGAKTYSGLTTGLFFDPISEHSNDPPGFFCLECPLSERVGTFTNRDEDDSTPAHGIDAAILYFHEHSNETIYSLVASNAGKTNTARHFISQSYKAGDKVVLLGYSAGGKYVLALSKELYLLGIPVHAIGFIDPFMSSIPVVPPNVRKIAVYHQKSDEFDLQGVESFRSHKGSDTSYYSGHPKLISGSLNTGQSINHATIVYSQSVWKDFGQKMVALSPGSSSDDLRNGSRTEQEVDDVVDQGRLEEVVSSELAGTISNSDQKDGTPYYTPPGHDSTHHQDGTNKVGFDSMRIGSKSSDNWDDDVTWREDQIPGDKDCTTNSRVEDHNHCFVFFQKNMDCVSDIKQRVVSSEKI